AARPLVRSGRWIEGGTMTVAMALFAFFFQAEDGIRAGHVTGVQTCALPILRARLRFAARAPRGASPRAEAFPRPRNARPQTRPAAGLARATEPPEVGSTHPPAAAPSTRPRGLQSGRDRAPPARRRGDTPARA